MKRQENRLQREHAILWAAKSVFTQRGYELASMDEIAAKADMTKRTLYNHFASKETLFLEMARFASNLFSEKLGDVSDWSDNPIDAVSIFCARVLEGSCHEEAVHLQRVVIAETSRFPAASDILYHACIKVAESRLVSYLTDKRHDPLLRIDDPVRLAVLILGATTSLPRFDTLFGVRPGFRGPPGPGLAAGIDLAPLRLVVRRLIGVPE
ncbi:MAG: TetR/AcrR family transcriptional regulator [Alphaproteobacteria bacterium]|nr:TetR/AcrR family transcriptional regulator [Alphaproteobacteria bacterium]